jgi:hypothetical protein
MSDVYATWHQQLGHRQYRITVTMSGHGADPEAGEMFLDGFLSKHPEIGPVVSQDADADTISVTFTLDASDDKHAIGLADVVFSSGGIASGVPAGEILRLELEPAGAESPITEEHEPLPA